MSKREAQSFYARSQVDAPAPSPVEAPAASRHAGADSQEAPSHHGCHTVCCCHHAHHPAPHHSYREPTTANVVPVPLLQRWSALAQCPGCHEIAPTVVQYKSGKGTHWMATFFFFTTGIFAWVPYSMKHFKNAQHSCVHCKRVLATYRFGSGPRAHVV
ncbi:hypothetical protein PG990_000280 [Apiospora arundinis]|uniref:Litaf-like zinc finger domain-containing protein n=1 Tax=Apiospora arundinis TaxID=335852 RepID=A0ABR2HZE7_9PEZI